MNTINNPTQYNTHYSIDMLWAPKFRKLAKYMHMVSISLPTG